MEIDKMNEEQLEKERLEKERLEKEQLEKERIEKQKMENKLFPNNSLFIIPSWGDLLGYPTLGTYVHHPVSNIVSDIVIFLSGYDYSIETVKGTLHYLFGLGYYFLKFELESGKYITDNRILTGLVLPDFVYDHMATSINITLEEDRDVIIAEKVIKVPINLSNKSEDHLTFIKGALMRNVFIPNKDIFLEMMETIRKEDSYQISNEGHMILSADWDFFNQILVSDKMYKLTTPVSYTHLRAHESRHDLVCRLLLEKKKLENASKMLISGIPQISSKQSDAITRKTSKQSIFASAEDRLYAYISWPIEFKRKAKKEPPGLPRIAEQPIYTIQDEIQRSNIGTAEIPDYKQEVFELETLKSEKVAFKPLPDPPAADFKQILLYLKNVIGENYELQSIGKAFEIGRECMRQLGISATKTLQNKIWEMSKYANIYLKKEHGFGLSVREKQELIQKIDSWLFEIEEEERKEKERLERIRLEKERREKEEKERREREKREREKLERERLERERVERERLKQEQAEKERLRKIEEEKQEEIRLERERLESERKEQEAIEKEKQELERLKQERKQKEKEAKQEAKKRKKLEKQKKKIEKKKKKEQERLENL